jgi:hypothetical protein
MNAQVRRIAASNFLLLWNMRYTRRELAEHFGVDRRIIDHVVEYLSLQPVTKLEEPPWKVTVEEEFASQEYLELAPQVAKRAKECAEKRMEELRNESESASQTRGYEWRERQQDVTYRVYLSNGRVLQ